MTRRTLLQREADKIDCQIDRLVRRLMYLEQEIPSDNRIKHARLRLDCVRGDIRAMMHIEDRKKTS